MSSVSNILADSGVQQLTWLLVNLLYDVGPVLYTGELQLIFLAIQRRLLPRRKGYCPCLLYTSPSPRDGLLSRMPSSA